MSFGDRLKTMEAKLKEAHQVVYYLHKALPCLLKSIYTLEFILKGDQTIF
jgi:hypothetical protein